MMEFGERASLAAWLESVRASGKEVGFVPTMGALHPGHISLIERAERENQAVVASIFVNPTQFNNPDDLARYPRTPERDLEMLRHAGCHAVFVPSVDEMYPAGTAAMPDFDLGTLDQVMEGRFRPGHFKGVAAVVSAFFDIVRPDRAYFGKKDYQQLAVIRRMTHLQGLPLEIVSCDTVREPDGLAMSSRNVRLSEADRRAAPGIYKVLSGIREQAGKVPVAELQAWACAELADRTGFRVEYLEIADSSTLMPLQAWDAKRQAVALVAAYAGDVRLIDNLELFS